MAYTQLSLNSMLVGARYMKHFLHSTLMVRSSKRSLELQNNLSTLLPSYPRILLAFLSLKLQHNFWSTINIPKSSQFPFSNKATSTCLQHSLIHSVSNPSLYFQFSTTKSQHQHICHTDLVNFLFLHQPMLAIQQSWLSQFLINYHGQHLAITQNSHHTAHLTILPRI